MNKLNCFIVGAGSLFMLSCATEFSIISDDVPQAVLSTFKNKYPNASNAVWEVEKSEGRLIYEAEFKLDGKRKEAEFKPDGTFLKEE
jgi:hypothetical protein